VSEEGLRPSLRQLLRTVMARAYPRVRTLPRERSWLIIEITLPLLGTIAMVYVYRALQAPPRFTGFAILGGTMLAYWQNVLWSMATQLYWDRDLGNLELYAISPSSFLGILAGMASGGMVVSTTRAGAVLVVCSLLFQVHWDPAGVLPALGVFLLTLCALYGLGSVLAAAFLFYSREAWHIASALQEPVQLLSGFYFPVRSLTAAVGGAASLVPLTLGLDAIRQLLLPGSPALVGVGWETAALCVQIPLYAVAAHRALTLVEMLARRDGRLIVRQS
jgi:ABC-2 type transport system permease protein